MGFATDRGAERFYLARNILLVMDTHTTLHPASSSTHTPAFRALTSKHGSHLLLFPYGNIKHYRALEKRILYLPLLQKARPLSDGFFFIGLILSDSANHRLCTERWFFEAWTIGCCCLCWQLWWSHIQNFSQTFFSSFPYGFYMVRCFIECLE